MPQIYAAPLMRRYFGPSYSSGYLFRLLSIAVQVVIPFVISYSIKPFWLTESWYSEQPTVTFKHQMIVMLEGSTPGSDLIWSTYDQLNTMVGSKFRVAEVQSRSEDTNLDGKPDEVYIYARFPLTSTEKIYHARFITFFDYQLTDRIDLQMESAAYFDHTSTVSGSSCFVKGTLELKQKSILPVTNSIRSVYNETIIAASNGGINSIKQVLFTTVIPDYLARNETTAYTTQYPIWTAGASTSFVLEARLEIPYQQMVHYQPGVLECLRYAIVQYLVIYVFVGAICGAATHFLFENQVFETRVHDDSRPKNRLH